MKISTAKEAGKRDDDLRFFPNVNLNSHIQQKFQGFIVSTTVSIKFPCFQFSGRKKFSIFYSFKIQNRSVVLRFYGN